MNASLKQYALITANYWAFTLTDGALRMLVVLYFHQLGYAPLDIALLFLFYEFFGVVTNLFGGLLGARIGLNKTMNLGTLLQMLALGLLLVPTAYLTIPLVMGAQALSGIAKDLNKMSAKSAIKFVVSDGETNSSLYRYVAALTGSKNALKGVGFFLGGLLLSLLAFKGAVLCLIGLLVFSWLACLLFLRGDLGKKKHKPKFTEIFSKNGAINTLSAARFFLFGARDIWFVIAVPVFFSAALGWSHEAVGSFMAAWVIAYGAVQALTPKFISLNQKNIQRTVTRVTTVLAFVLLTLLASIEVWGSNGLVLVIGLLAFGAVFAIASATHSYAIVSLAREDGASLDVGFYYMANAGGRLVGTVLSGALFQAFGLTACLWGSLVFTIMATLISRKI